MWKTAMPFAAGAFLLSAIAGCGSAPSQETVSPAATGAPVAAGGTTLTCPVMKGAIADPANAPRLVVNNQPILFCCGACSDPLKKEPALYLKKPLKDPVTGEPFTVTKESPKLERDGALFLFATEASRKTFEKDPAAYVRSPGGASS